MRKSVLISEELHKELKELSALSGISLKNLMEMGIKLVIKRVKIREEDE